MARAWIPLVSSFFVLTAACGSSPSSSLFDEPAGDGGATDGSTSDSSSTDGTPGTDTGPGGGKDTGSAGDTSGMADVGASPTTLDNVCERLADNICTASMQTCCSSKSVTYSESGCRTGVTAACQKRVDAVMAGDATFNPDAFAACAVAWNALVGKCSIPILDYVKAYAPCDQLFDGATPLGDSCGTREDCKVDKGAFAACNSSTCVSFTVAPKDGTCDYGAPTYAICDYGLACNFTTSTSGTCRAAKTVGTACAENYECGFGYYCAKSFGGGMGKCAAGTGVGTYCSNDATCASGNCASGKCTDPNVLIALPLFCNGSAG